MRLCPISPVRCAGFVSIFLLAAASLGRAAPPEARPPAPRVRSSDAQRRVDLNQLNMALTNYGPIAFDVSRGGPGLIYPRGDTKTVVYASGLWIGCKVGGATRVVVSEYSSEYGPGSMTSGGFDNPENPLYRTYKVARFSGDPQDTAHVERTAAELAADPNLDSLRHHSWSEYLAGAAPSGAPTRWYRFPVDSTPAPDDSVDVLGPDVMGDLMTWAVYNDADPARHFGRAGSTPPLGVVVQQTAFAFDRPGPLGSSIFLRFKIVNAGPNLLEDAFVSLWSDPDLGGPADDLVGCHLPLSLGYCYNATSNDVEYGSAPPAIGYELLQGPRSGTGEPRALYAFNKYISGTEPSSATETYNYMQGLLPDGSPLIDPTTSAPTRYFHPGDPVAVTGWIDSNPSDRRMLLSSGPFTMAPRDTQEVWAAIVVSRGNNRFESILRLVCDARYIWNDFNLGFPEPPPSTGDPCPTYVNCPRPPSFWEEQCSRATLLTSAQVESIAVCVNQSWTFFDWPSGSSLAQFCSAVGAAADIRARAKSEFLALAGTACAAAHGIVPNDGKPLLISPATSVSCPGLVARNVNELLTPASTTRQLIDAAYLDLVADHRRPIEGVNFGGGGFDGGADVAYNFLGSALDPSSQPDSFGTVRIDFGATPQMAYRFLRLERRSDGSAPPQGRSYLYGGFHPVGFTVRDSATGEQLDVAFVERCITDDAGTILPPVFQVATFDSTWAPDTTTTGGREYLFVLKTPYGAAPRPFIARDGAPTDQTLPALYALWSKRRETGDVFDAGDAFVFRWGTPPTPGVDAELIRLEGLPLSDPAVEQAYADIAGCLSDINRGVGIGPVCDRPTPVLGALVAAVAERDRTLLTWRVDKDAGPLVVERRRERAGWLVVTSPQPNPSGDVAYEDRDVVAGTRYGYRLMIAGNPLGEVWLEIPREHHLSFAGLRPNPAEGRLIVSLTLATRGPATLEFFDVHGRRVVERRIDAPLAGQHQLDLGRSSQLPAGVYLVRLVQGKQEVSGKAVVVH